jgi:hypothetical protein
MSKFVLEFNPREVDPLVAFGLHKNIQSNFCMIFGPLTIQQTVITKSSRSTIYHNFIVRSQLLLYREHMKCTFD